MGAEEKVRLLRQMATARTLQEIEAARQAQEAWLRQHPDDLEVRLSGEQLGMAEAALRATARRRSA